MRKNKKQPQENIPSIRGQYEAHGVRDYYARHGADYVNPHEQAIRKAMIGAVAEWGPDLSAVLDLAAGSGEVTLILRELGAGRIEGIDPYTSEAYLARTGQPAEELCFEEIAGGALAGRRYSLIVCSFALHLIDQSWLPAVLAQLSLVSDSLLILTPHKRPGIKREWGWNLAGELVVDRVRARFYRV